MAVPPRAETLKIEQLEDRTTPTATVTADVLNMDPSHYVAGQVLFTLAPGVDRTATLTALGNSPWAYTAEELPFGVFKLKLRAGVTVKDALEGLNGNGQLGLLQPDIRKYKAVVPNDPAENDGTQWEHHNTGQNGGTAGADISAQQAWNYGRGTGKHIVAIIDSGLDITHEDLAANLWVNPDPTAPDQHGYDFADNDPDPSPVGDPNDHGTHVAGIVGMVGNNGLGGVGVAWKTSLMGLRFDFSGSSELQAINYAITHGASIINASYGSYSYDAAEDLAFQAASAAGIITVNAAGNSGRDSDLLQNSPTNFSVTNNRLIAVAATDRNDKLASFSEYGAKTITLAAPGVEIYSTLPGNQYGPQDGTSEASPIVAGALAVVWDAFPSLTPDELIKLMKDSVDQLPSLQGKTVTGGRLDLLKMFQNATFGGYAVGADAGGGPVVKVFAPDGTQRSSFFAFPSTFTGGVRVAMSDVNGDRVPDIIAVPGTGSGPVVKVFDGSTQQELYSFYAYPTAFTAGMYVAAGDVDGDGQAEIITGAAEGGGSVVRVFKLLPGGHIKQLTNFYAFDPGFSGGVRVAAGDMNNDGRVDIVTSAGFGGSPFVRVFDGVAAATGTRAVQREFMAGDANSTGGAYVTIGHINNDSGYADYVVGSGDSTREVRVYNGRTLSFTGGFNAYPPSQTSAPLVNDSPPAAGTLTSLSSTPNQLPATATQTTTTATRSGGFRVAVLDLNNDGVDDIIAGGGPGDESIVRIRNGQSMTALGVDRNVFGNIFNGGVFVAASR